MLLRCSSSWPGRNRVGAELSDAHQGCHSRDESDQSAVSKLGDSLRWKERLTSRVTWECKLHIERTSSTLGYELLLHGHDLGGIGLTHNLAEL